MRRSSEGRSREASPPWPARLAVAHGVFYILTGVWPLVSLSTFELVTGPKTDDWLVQTVGALILAVGLVLLAAGLRGRVPTEVALLGAASALAFAFVDVRFVAEGRISTVYLLDAAAEVALACAWAALALLPRTSRRGSPI
jgi:hypothetical protein